MADRVRVIPKDKAPLAGRPWTAHYDEGVPATLEYPDVPLHALLEDAARSHPDATATIFLGAKRTYAALQRDATFFSAGLRRLGVKQGDRVALMLPNCPQFLIAFFGALRLGAAVVPCNPLYTPREIQHQLSDCGAETVVVLSRLYPVVKAARPGTSVRNVVVTNIKEEMPPVLRLLFTLAKEKKEGHRTPWRSDQGTVAFRELLADAGEPVAAPVSPDDLAVLQYTGGTTGVPKGAMLSHRALVANTLQCRSWFTNLRDGQDVAMAVMPLFHVYGLTVAMALSVQAAAAIILEPQFDLHRILKDIQKYRPKIFPGAPRIYNAIVNAPEAAKYDLRSIEACISGSAPLMVETAKRFGEMTGGRLVEGYGLTEAAPVTHCNPIFGEGKQKVGSIGVPFPDVESKIVDLDTGTREMPVGEPGELVLRGPNLMDGYYQKDEETRQTIRDGWLHTGDIATVDAEGYVSIVDRKKELIIVSGFNVYPREVEEALAAHPAVLEGAAIGVPHPLKGEEVKAFVVLRPGMTATPEDIMAFCRERLAPFKVPREVEVRGSLPKTIIGKVLRRQLADEEKARRSAR
ncbi:MAG TPA: long-chain fatty acid--CoA ligase [Candidatus Limnocylindria bacterium]|nr:long-chain fatty acid--CoA ligase [Candidatus Limnocylindria bacterium]